MSTPPARRPTLADVAALAGTSTAVVSYVVNGGPRAVADVTRARVQSAIDELGYRRNALAGALHAGRTELVGLLVPDSSNAFFSELARHVEGAARTRGLLTLLGNTAYSTSTEHGYLAAISDLRPSGIVVATVSEEREAPSDCPRVYLHSAPSGTNDPSVMTDDEDGAAAAVDHLLQHGHSRVDVVTGPSPFGPAGRREAGWRRMVRTAGRRGDMHRVPFDRIDAERTLTAVLDGADRPPAVFATTDELALATLHAAGRLGVRVPEELAIIGFDGIREALLGTPPLTTVAVPFQALAEAALDALTAHRAGRSLRVVASRLVFGRTCGCG